MESYTARLTGAGMSAEATVYAYGDDGLPRYFEDLAEHWRGWPGARSWSSLEGQLSLDAEHDGLGTIRVAARLTPDAAILRWSASLVLQIDAGGLDHAATAPDASSPRREGGSRLLTERSQQLCEGRLAPLVSGP